MEAQPRRHIEPPHLARRWGPSPGLLILIGNMSRMSTGNVNLTEHLDRFIEAGVTSRFSNASEVVREGLRLLEQRDQQDRANAAFSKVLQFAGR